MQLVGAARARTIVVSIAVVALLLGVVAAPVRASNGHHGGDHDDDYLEWARDFAIGVVDHKIDRLRHHREGAETDQAWTIYSEAIEELGDIKELIGEEDDVDTIWELKYHAIDRYKEAKKLAKAADKAGEDKVDDPDDDSDDTSNDKKTDEEEGKKKQQEEARKRKEAEEAKKKQEEEERKRREAEEARKRQEEEERKRQAEEEQRRLEELADARDETLHLIDKKVRLMTAASFSAGIPKVADIYREAADAIAALRPAAEEAETVERLEAIRSQVWDIVEAAKRQADECRPGQSDDDDDDPADDAVEEQAIRTALNAMELEVDMYQIEIELTIDPIAGIGFPEGPVALDAGSALLDAIDAARLLTGDELVIAYVDVNDQYNEYMNLVLIFDLEWQVGIFAGQVSPI